MQDSTSLGSTSSFTLADTSLYSCVSNDTMIPRISMTHIKQVPNWEVFRYPQRLHESWGTAGTEARTRTQIIIKVTGNVSGKTISNSQCITEAHCPSCQTQASAGGLLAIQGRLKIMQDPRGESWVLVFFTRTSWVCYSVPRFPSARGLMER